MVPEKSKRKHSLFEIRRWAFDVRRSKGPGFSPPSEAIPWTHLTQWAGPGLDGNRKPDTSFDTEPDSDPDYEEGILQRMSDYVSRETMRPPGAGHVSLLFGAA